LSGIARIIAFEVKAVESGAANIAGTLVVFGPVAMIAGLLTAGLIVLSMPWLRAYALARPNARSSHREPTPQGGGVAIVLATLATTWAAVIIFGIYPQGTGSEFLALTAAVVALAIVGAIDDIHHLSPLPRLLLQCLAIGVVIAALPQELRVVPMLPWWIERACFLFGAVWFVNLTNFMDGVDWMTVAETVPIAGAIVLLGLLDAVSALPTLVALALLGAMLGFAPFNRPVAKLFLGDVGSLPIGLLLAWLLLRVAAAGYLAAAIILPLYYIADATLTLGRRLANGERVWQAHRSHFYQRALDGGFSVTEVVARVLLVNCALVALALIAVADAGGIISWGALGLAVLFVSWLLAVFATGKS
jgi:UDP-N-acetylmuramyl pentapeptide phosphotransferase/UDP-N-acetylglucosamine-1-phosphate transferase